MDGTLTVHVAAGGLGIVSGFVALYSTKGAPLHRKIGLLFVAAMLTMTVLGGMMAVVRDAAPALNIPPSLLTGYLIITALMTVRPPFRGSRALAIALMVLVLTMSVTAITMGFEGAVNGWTRKGMPAFPFFMFGTVGLLAGVSDLRVIRYGNPVGPARLVRHLWRMGFALFIAALSFFVGQSDEFPEAIRIIPLLALPGLAVLVTMLFWIWRLKVRRSVKGIAIASGSALQVTGRIVTES